MNKFLKNFVIGGLMVAIAEYFIHKDTDNIKYVSIMVHGAPLAFLATYLVLKDRKKEILLIKNVKPFLILDLQKNSLNCLYLTTIY